MKLTNVHREAALNLLTKKIKDEHEKNCKAIMEEVVEDYIKGLDKDLIKVFINHKSYFHEFWAAFDNYLRITAKLPMPISWHCYNENFITDKKLKDKINKAKAVTKEISDLAKRTSRILEKYTTDKMLIADFPECEKLFNVETGKMLPAIPVEQIRSELKLSK